MIITTTQDSNGTWFATSTDVPSLFTAGRTADEARRGFEAAAAQLRVVPEDSNGPPPEKYVTYRDVYRALGAAGWTQPKPESVVVRTPHIGVTTTLNRFVKGSQEVEVPAATYVNKRLSDSFVDYLVSLTGIDVATIVATGTTPEYAAFAIYNGY